MLHDSSQLKHEADALRRGKKSRHELQLLCVSKSMLCEVQKRESHIDGIVNIDLTMWRWFQFGCCDTPNKIWCVCCCCSWNRKAVNRTNDTQQQLPANAVYSGMQMQSFYIQTNGAHTNHSCCLFSATHTICESANIITGSFYWSKNAITRIYSRNIVYIVQCIVSIQFHTVYLPESSFQKI